jgi:hypothetical protein
MLDKKPQLAMFDSLAVKAIVFLSLRLKSA